MKDVKDNPDCLRFDHYFDPADLYDSEGLPNPEQLFAQCKRCGITMAQSFRDLVRECDILTGKSVHFVN